MDSELKNKNTDETTLGRKSLNYAIFGFGMILIVLLVGAVVVMGSLLKQFIDGRGIGNRKVPSDYVLGTLLIREAPLDSKSVLSNINDGDMGDISRTVLLASLKVRAYSQNGIPLPDVVCFGVVMEETGYIITSTDVIRDESILEVELYDGSFHQARVVGYDLKTDLCVLKIEGNNLRTASFGSGGMKTGDGCLYVGLGQRGIVNISQGIIGATEGRYLETEAGYSYMRLTATDRVASDRCTGGVIVNSLGQIVGFRCSKADDSQNMIYAFSVEDARSIIDSIIKNGYVNNRLTLGLAVERVSEVVSKQNRLPVGLVVLDMDAMKSALEQEIYVGDIIVAVSDEEVATVYDYQEVLSRCSESVVLKIYRPSSNVFFETELPLLEDTGLYMH